MTAILVGAAIALSPALLILAAIFGSVAYLLYFQASGQMLDRLYRGVERRAATRNDRRRRRSDGGRGGFGAGPREEWTPPRQEQRQRARRQRVRQERRRRQQTQNSVHQSRQSVRQASQVLGVSPDADESTVRRAYRDRIKEVHPDAEGGDEEVFKRVQEAYEVLTET
jgi:hypothetical protein